MKTLKEKLLWEKNTVSGFLKELSRVFNDMDEKYERVARDYGFQCRGCVDNCCLTRFHHHTVLEYAWLMEGFEGLSPRLKEGMKASALAVMQAHGQADLLKTAPRIMCPLNIDGLCVLYAHRPMICRLHGIPHEISLPSGGKKFGPGCGAFDEKCGTREYVPFDRTPFYVRMSSLEQSIRRVLELDRKIKMTIAEMIVS